MSAVENMLLERLKRHFRAPEYALIRGVRDAAGFEATRTADAVAMGIWPSRGLHLHGCELKASRGDWLKELRNPAKAEQIARLCDKWWVVVPDRSIIQDGELPEQWGLIEAGEKRTVVVKDAPLLNPLPLSRSFLAALLRRYVEQHAPDAEVARARADGVLEGRKIEREAAQAAIESEEREYRDLVEKVELFETASGVPIRRGWDLPKIGNVVRHLVGRYDTPGEVMERLARTAGEIQQRALEAAEESRQLLAQLSTPQPESPEIGHLLRADLLETGLSADAIDQLMAYAEAKGMELRYRRLADEALAR